MAKTKNYYYVLVFEGDGPAYVTSVNNATSYARWDKDKAPLALPKYYAEELAVGLNLNCHQAVMVTSKWELTHPYMYQYYDCKFIPKE